MNCCGHFELPHADCLCEVLSCWCNTARLNPLDLALDLPLPPQRVEPTDLDSLLEATRD